MKLKAAFIAATLALSSAAYAGELVDKTEPPATPAGGRPEAGIGVAGGVGLGILAVTLIAIAGGGDDDGTATATATATGTN